MIVGYVRVSSITQNESRQLITMEKHNVEKLFIDKVSGKDTNRPQLNSMLDFIREGDTVVIHSFDRLARNTKDLLTIVEDLNNRGINLLCEKDNIDTNTPNGKLMLTMLGAIAEFERQLMLERQREGIALAKAEGKYKGRKTIEKPKNWDEVYNKWKHREITAIKAMQELGLKKSTFYKILKQYESANI